MNYLASDWIKTAGFCIIILFLTIYIFRVAENISQKEPKSFSRICLIIGSLLSLLIGLGFLVFIRAHIGGTLILLPTITWGIAYIVSIIFFVKKYGAYLPVRPE